MTDTIIKALECCVSGNCTQDCPFYYDSCIKCKYSSSEIIKFAFDIVKQQEAEIEKLQLDNHNLWMKADILTDFINGEWIDTENIQTALNIDFSTGMERFDFSRTAEWNPPPLNGQKITTKFRLSHNKAINEFADKILNESSTMDSRIISADRVKKILAEMAVQNE